MKTVSDVEVKEGRLNSPDMAMEIAGKNLTIEVIQQCGGIDGNPVPFSPTTKEDISVHSKTLFCSGEN